ncbi:26478_t:CDS:2 [Gigaspora margarita]|uniref:26478_t:CDS:1 n=1 Tax=Gigaspora margarita TaxID=4874 RepID=A0ABN7VLM9_GIGMA|nr:26478_t:CDS:2 [Gigaspora margarita]
MKLLLFTLLCIIIKISTVLGQTVPIVQATPAVQGSPTQPNVAASPLATGDVSTCSTCDKVKVACGSKFNLPIVNSQGSYIASDKCYCSSEMYDNLSQCLTCYNGANVGNSTWDSLDNWKLSCISLGSPLDQNNTTQSNKTIVQPTNNNKATASSDDNIKETIGIAGCAIALLLLVIGLIVVIKRHHRRSSQVGDFPDMSKRMTKNSKSLEIIESYKRETNFPNHGNNDNQFKKNVTKQNERGVMVDVDLNDNKQPTLSSNTNTNTQQPTLSFIDHQQPSLSSNDQLLSTNDQQPPLSSTNDQQRPLSYNNYQQLPLPSNTNNYQQPPLSSNTDNYQQPPLSTNYTQNDIPNEYDQFDDDNETIGQAIIPVAVAAPEIITIIPEVHVIDETSIINFGGNDNFLFESSVYILAFMCVYS